jgi:hypothetical protein
LIVKDGAFVTTFFPYSTHDLIQLFRRVIKTNLNLQKQIDIMSNISESVENRVESTKKIVDYLRQEFSHFHAFDHVCVLNKIVQKTFSDKEQPQVARIIIFDRSQSQDLEAIINDPLSTIFPLLLGCHIPTYYTFADLLFDKGDACAPDVTYIDYGKIRQMDEKFSEQEYGALVAIRFFEESSTLVVSGLRPCSDGPIPSEINLPRALNNLYHLWCEWCLGSIHHQQFFDCFPMESIIKKYKL